MLIVLSPAIRRCHILITDLHGLLCYDKRIDDATANHAIRFFTLLNMTIYYDQYLII